MPPLLGGYEGEQVAGGEYGAGPYPVPASATLTGAAAVAFGLPEPLDSEPGAGPFKSPPIFHRSSTQAERISGRRFLQQHGFVGGGGGGYDPFGYFTSGARYYARRGAEVATDTLDYISNIPGELGEAGGELLEGLGAGAGAGLGSLVDPLTSIPGDLFKNIPIWVPVLGAAFLLTR